MKILALLSAVFTAQMAFAGGTGDPILTKITSAGALPPQYRSIRTVEVFGLGDVRVTVEKGFSKKSVLKGPLSPAKMKSIYECRSELAKAKEAVRPNCAGGTYAGYSVDKKLVSVRSCGEVNTVDVSCVDSLIKLLDRL